ncbi:MAG: hypothetical protein EOO65_02355 [Methanosarcinales archaeon]|nr:MAG: hypothetical protein EOO65_02355 [Methanosarcinales archaeon]
MVHRLDGFLFSAYACTCNYFSIFLVWGCSVQSAVEGTIGTGKSAESYARALRDATSPISKTQLEALRVQLSTCERDWIVSFFASDGLDAFATALKLAVDQRRIEHVRLCLEGIKTLTKLDDDVVRLGKQDALGMLLNATAYITHHRLHSCALACRACHQ